MGVPETALAETAHAGTALADTGGSRPAGASTGEAPATATPPARFPYHGALDGLRALALVAIVAYHLDYGWAHGAFLSVDLFFLLSGFLITTLLIVEWQRTGTISLRRFWSRRARRLIPALLVTLVAVAAFTRFEVDPWMRTSVRNDAIASLTYVANWRFIASDQGYFQTFAAPSPLRHMWTLAIEEQFYIVWPMITIAALRLGRGRRGIVAVCLAGSLASVAIMAGTYRPGDPLRAYYGTDTRLHVILIGALLAVLLSVWQPSATARRRIAVVGVVAFAAMMVAWATAHGTASPYYHGGSVLHALVACVVLTACLHPGPVRAVLGIGVMAWIGRLSYGLYLFHWPIIVWFVPNRVHLDGLALDAARIGLTVVAAVISYYLIELPIRERRAPTVVAWARERWRRPAEPAVAPRGNGGPPDAVQPPDAPAGDAARGPRARRRLAPVLVVPAIAATAVVIAASAGGSSPPPEYLVGDREAGKDLAEAVAPRDEEINFGDPLPCGPPGPETQAEAQAALSALDPTLAAGRRVVLVGDSTACSLYPGLQAVVTGAGGQIDNATVVGCGVASGEMANTRGEQVTPNSHRCPDLVAAIHEVVFGRFQPDVVVWMSVWEKSDLVTDDGETLVSGTDEAEEEIQRRMDAALTALTQDGARVVLLTVPAASPHDAVGAGDTSNPIDDASYDRLDGILRRFAERHPDQVTLVDMAERLCPGGAPCPAEVDGALRRPDGRHLSPAAATWLAEWLLPHLVEPAAP